SARPSLTGTPPKYTPDYHDLIFLKDADSLYVNLYTPAKVVWQRDGGAVTVQQHTRFPESDTVELNVACKNESRFALKLRSPSWLASPMLVEVNGEATNASAGK